MNIADISGPDRLALQKANAIRKRIQNAENRVKAAEARKLVGKCFRYRNTYGSGRASWWLYYRIDRADSIGGVHGLKFQVIPGGRYRMAKIEIEVNDYLCSFPDMNYHEITGRQFGAALRKMQQTVARLRHRK